MEFYEFDCGCKIPLLNKQRKECDNLPSIHIDYDNINFHCDPTWDLICRGQTKGIFQLEKQLGQSWAKRTQPRSIEELAALISLIRPGCLEAKTSDGRSMTQLYVDRKHNGEPIEYIHPVLEPILSPTQGILVYQEQAMEIAAVVAGFNQQEADILRKAIGKKDVDIMAEVKINFIKKCKETGIVNDEIAQEIFDIIEKSQRYSFNKSHAVSYAFMGYWSAYTKYHAETHFFCSWLAHAKAKPKPQEEINELISDSKLSDVTVRGPSLLSLLIGDEGEFCIYNDGVDFGVRDIKRVGSAQLSKLITDVKAHQRAINKSVKEWSWYEFLINFSDKITSTLAKNLIQCGALTYMGYSRREMLFQYEVWNKLTKKEKEWIQTNCQEYSDLGTAIHAAIQSYDSYLIKKDKLLRSFSNIRRYDFAKNLIKLLNNPPHSLFESVDWIARTETELLGAAVTCNKIDGCDTHLATTTCREFINGANDKNMRMTVEIIDIRTWVPRKYRGADKKTQKESEMAFITVEDTTAKLDAVVCFSDKWKTLQHILYPSNTVLLSGYRSERDSFVINKASQI